MARKRKSTARSNPNAVLLNNNVYAVKGSKNRKPHSSVGADIRASAKTGKQIKQAKQMALIEAYAREHGVSIAQAMIHFM